MIVLLILINNSLYINTKSLINDKNDYPVPEEVMQETISKPVAPYVTGQNPGSDNLNNSKLMYLLLLSIAYSASYL